MWDEILKSVPVFFLSMLKFVPGLLLGYAVKLNMLTTILVAVAGMMTTILGFAFFGDFLRKRVMVRLLPKRKRFTERSRKIVTIWKKYGLFGVAALTPIFFTPIGGALIAVSFGTPKDKLIVYMFVSASVWGVALALLIYLFGNQVAYYFTGV